MRTVTRRLFVLVAAGFFFMTLGAWLVVDQPALADLVWRKVFVSAWLSWISAPTVWVALALMRKRLRIGWVAYVISQIALFSVGVLLGQWGFCAIGTVNMGLAVEGWRSWGKPTPNEQRLERELREARDEIAWLRAERDQEALPA
jgi:hypothetical protein